MTKQGLCALIFLGVQAEWSPYRKYSKSDVPFAAKYGKKYATAEEANIACTKDPVCRAYNSNGELKKFAGCEWGSDWCIYPHGAQEFAAANEIDLYVKTGAAPPEQWVQGIAAGSILYSQPEPDICMMPEVGNGFVASIVGFSSMHVSGFFNGGCGGVRKAHLPSVIGISVTNADEARTQSALDMDRAVYVRRLYFEGSPAVVEQRTYAHRVRKHVLVTEFELLSGCHAIQLNLTTLFDPLCGNPPPPLPTPAPPTPAPPPPGPAFNGTYLHVVGDSGPNGFDVASLPQCASGGCPVSELKEACDKNPACDLFQTHGFLKRCSNRRNVTSATAACDARTPWVGVDAFYKIRSPSPDVGAAGPAAAAAAAAAAANTGFGSFGAGAPCGTAGKGCAGSFKQDLYFERLPTPPAVYEPVPPPPPPIGSGRGAGPASRAAGSGGSGNGEVVTVFRGNTTRANETGQRDSAVIVSRAVPATLVLLCFFF